MFSDIVLCKYEKMKKMLKLYNNCNNIHIYLFFKIIWCSIYHIKEIMKAIVLLVTNENLNFAIQQLLFIQNLN